VPPGSSAGLFQPTDAIAESPRDAEGSLVPAWISGVLALVAAVVLVGNCLLNSPPRFSEKHYQDDSLLRDVVTVLALGGAFPTARGVEVRNLVYYLGAAITALLAGLGLVMARRRPNLSLDDLMDIRGRAAHPAFWWLLLLLVSALSSYYAHAPDVCRGQTTIRLMNLAWWWSLAAMLTSADARRLARALLATLGATAALGMWYHAVRVMPDIPDARLQYPIGNELWLAACLLPGLFIGVAMLIQGFAAKGGAQSGSSFTDPAPIEDEEDLRPARRTDLVLAGAGGLAVLILAAAILLTRSRSALAGLAAGLVVMLCLATGRRTRRVVALFALLAALGGAWWVQHLRAEGRMGQRAHSIRARLNYEWPYAINLFLKKPVAGNGDGAYSLLAGQFARLDQFDDPGTIRFDETSWTAHAHNEFLELLADLGIAGCAAFAVALLLTLYRAMRFCDAAREEPGSRRSVVGTLDSNGPSPPATADLGHERWLVIGLSSALAAMAVEQCSDSALREPGLPAVFFATWAVLGALTRSAARPRPCTDEAQRLTPLTVRLFGGAVILVSVYLGYAAIADWRGARARFESTADINAGRFAHAVSKADSAARNLLDPFQRTLARMIGISARSLAFDAALASTSGPPADSDMELSRQALMLLARLNFDAPRFLRLSRLASELYLNRARAFERLGDKTAQRDAEKRFIETLTASVMDEPFMVERVAALWQANTKATAVDRLQWLRWLLRNGEMDEQFLQLFETLPRYPDFRQAIEDLFALAVQESTKPVEQWEDRLVPETFRLAARARLMAGDPSEAEKLAGKAEELYARIGPRLFTAHAAALHEMVRYSLAADPTGPVEKNLERLARAQTILAPPTPPSRPLRGKLGRTRLAVLLAAGHMKDAELQAELLSTTDGRSARQIVAEAYVDAARLCLVNPARAVLAAQFAEKAAENTPDAAEVNALLALTSLQSGRDDRAFEAAEKFLRSARHREDAIGYLRQLRQRYPSSAIWPRLEKLHPDTALPPSSQPTTQPAP